MQLKKSVKGSKAGLRKRQKKELISKSAAINSNSPFKILTNNELTVNYILAPLHNRNHDLTSRLILHYRLNFQQPTVDQLSLSPVPVFIPVLLLLCLLVTPDLLPMSCLIMCMVKGE